jgi:hypothetical protein
MKYGDEELVHNILQLSSEPLPIKYVSPEGKYNFVTKDLYNIQ